MAFVDQPYLARESSSGVQVVKLYRYTPGMWEEVAYRQRKFFDAGGWLAARPMDELPHWRVVMRRERDVAGTSIKTRS